MTEFTIGQGHEDVGKQMLKHDDLVGTEQSKTEENSQAAIQTAESVACPFCGSPNDSGAVFCLSCGKPLSMGACPNCGNEMDPDADFCEVCHHYVKVDVCSFCGAQLSGTEAYCPECGSPRGGIVCPTCHTLNDFAFCKQCGAPLTEEAQLLIAEMSSHPEYQEMMQLAREYEELQMKLPYSSERDLVRDQMNFKLRERVLSLLAKDRGQSDEQIVIEPTKRMSKEELQHQKEEKIEALTRLLESMATPAQPSPVKARNYAMALKPVGVKMAWVCNYKGAMHSSPCGCAKPQLGGKWILLGKNIKKEIKDDKS